MKLPDPRFPVDRVHRSTAIALILMLGFWAWFFGNTPSSPDYWRVPKTTPVKGGKDG